MPVTQDRLTRLREFGLSEYAARAYLALLDLGIAEARDVSSISKVPQAKIYHVLEQLHEKGLVVILPEFPKKYAPIPFEEYLTRLYDEHTKAARAIEEERVELAEMFRVLGQTDVGDRGFFTVIRGRRNVLAKIEEMIVSVKRDLLVLGTAGTVSRSAHFLPEFGRATERGVSIRMILPVRPDTMSRLLAISGAAELRGRELGDEDQSAKVAIVVADGTTAFLIHFVPDDENLYAGKDIGVFTDQEAMVAAIQAIVEPLWKRAPAFDASQREGAAPALVPVATMVDPADHRAEQEARRLAEARLSAVLVAAPVGIAVLDAQGTVVEASERFAQMVGLEADVMRKLTVADFVAERDRERLEGAFARLRAGAVSERLTLRLLRAQDGDLAAQVVVTPVPGVRGGAAEFVLHAQLAPSA